MADDKDKRVITIGGGAFRVEWPREHDAGDVEDFEYIMQLALRQMRRKVAADASTALIRSTERFCDMLPTTEEPQ